MSSRMSLMSMWSGVACSRNLGRRLGQRDRRPQNDDRDQQRHHRVRVHAVRPVRLPDNQRRHNHANVAQRIAHHVQHHRVHAHVAVAVPVAAVAAAARRLGRAVVVAAVRVAPRPEAGVVVVVAVVVAVVMVVVVLMLMLVLIFRGQSV